MNERIIHRGPDGSRIYVDDGITLGHNRLAIIDVSDASAQPMQSTDGRYVLVYNGELYNYRELRAELSPHYPFKTKGDSEVLLAAYAVWGLDMFPKLRGIFAFGIWDRKEKELLLARDHMGVKPLYYAFEEGVLSFSSELHGLLEEGGTLDHRAVQLFLSLQYVPSDMTFASHVRKLPPGHYMLYREGKIDITCYYDHLHKPLIKPTGSLYEIMDRAVERQLISERPVGVFLSGGFDSSIVLHHTKAHSEKVRTYSIGFDVKGETEQEIAKYNADATLAKQTALHYGTEHTDFFLRKEDVRDQLEHIYQVLDEPVSTSTSVSQYFLNKRVREDGVVVALGGDGGDELFGGYTRHRAIMAAYLFQKLPNLVQEGVGRLHPRGKKLQTALYAPLHYELMGTDPSTIRSILKDTSLDSEEITKEFLESKYTNIPDGLHPLEVYMRVDRTTWLADHSLMRSDKTSMAHGIEFRVPILDLDVVEYADALSAYKKTDPFTGKKLIRDTYRNHLPSHLYSQPKRGWLSPGAKWLRDPIINPTIRAILSSEYYNGLDALLDWNKVQAMLEGHRKGGSYALHPLWSILILQIWARAHNLKY